MSIVGAAPIAAFINNIGGIFLGSLTIAAGVREYNEALERADELDVAIARARFNAILGEILEGATAVQRIAVNAAILQNNIMDIPVEIRPLPEGYEPT